MQQKPESAAPVFIVGTGRCGSTMLSAMLNEHPAILSLSEFFTFVTDLGSRISHAFPDKEIDGEQFWRILSIPYRKQNMMLWHNIAMDEVLYPYTSPDARYDAESGVPAILQTTLPHLTPDHDQLFDELQTAVTTFSPAPIQKQYRRLFTWLQQRFNHHTWIERSGSSLRIIARLYDNFPDARFVHVIRDGRDCAISMSQHLGFRMVLIAFYLLEVMGCDPYEDEDRSMVGDLPDELYPFLPEHFDGEAFRTYEIAPSLFGHYWSGELQQGLSVLSQIPPERVLTLHYEEILASPQKQLRELISFIDPTYVDETWIQRASALVRAPRSTWRTLPSLEQKQLEQACQPGNEALRLFIAGDAS